MKKFIWFVAGIVLATSFSAFAKSDVDCKLFDPVNPSDFAKYCDSDKAEKMFEDDDDTADWAKDSVKKLYNKKVINGYEDDHTFRPNKPVTRAELAVILDRFGKKAVDDNIYEYTFALDRLGYIDLGAFDDKSVNAALIASESGFFMMNEVPEGFTANDPDLFSEDESLDVPAGYSVYNEVPYAFYLRYEGDRYVGQDSIPVDEWFGPFSYYDGAYDR